jgi:hypothetical protein
MERLLDISVSGRKAAQLKAKGRPKVDRAARECAMRNTRDEIAAARARYDEEDRAGAVMPPVAANDNVAGDNVAPDSIADGNKARTIKSFHRLWTEKSLHKTNAAMNDHLYFVGEKYKRSFADAGGTASSQPPPYVPPVQGYDAYRQIPIVPDDKALPYYEAANVLDALEIREVVEAIVVRDRQIVQVGEEYSRYATDPQARAAAITALRIGLIALRNHYYNAAKIEIAA